MTEIIGVKFKSGGKQYYFNPNGLTVKTGQGVIVETGKGLEYGTCSRPNGFVEDSTVIQPLRPVIRLATETDEQIIAENVLKERQAMLICQKKIKKYNLDMKLVRVEYAFDGSKILFFFTSEGRVDFRALVKDLASVFHARIELRQIGVRDESRMLGGLGICGRPLCCSQFLGEFQPVSIKMAKTQNLSLNPTKISGTCGRLMCCLKYEQDAYEDAVRRCPKNESFVECPDGTGNVISVNLLREQVKVKLEESTDSPKTYSAAEIRVVRNGKGKRPDDYIPPSKEELEKLRFIQEEDNPQLQRYGNNRLAAAMASILDQQNDSSNSTNHQQPSRRRNQGRGSNSKKIYEQPVDKKKSKPQGEKRAKKSFPENGPSIHTGEEGEKKTFRRRNRPKNRGGKPGQNNSPFKE